MAGCSSSTPANAGRVCWCRSALVAAATVNVAMPRRTAAQAGRCIRQYYTVVMRRTSLNVLVNLDELIRVAKPPQMNGRAAILRGSLFEDGFLFPAVSLGPHPAGAGDRPFHPPAPG